MYTILVLLPHAQTNIVTRAQYAEGLCVWLRLYVCMYICQTPQLSRIWRDCHAF